MRIFIEYANGVDISKLDAEDFRLWDDWTREMVDIVWACQDANGFICRDSSGRKIECREEDQERLVRPMLRDFMTELMKTGSTDLRDYALRVYYEDEES